MIERLPLVSAIIPVHNRFELAYQAIESVISQTYRPIEIMIVDDASDKTIKLNNPEGYEGISIDIVRSDDNVGPGAAREIGRLNSTGDFICYLDSDDLWHQKKTATQVEVLKNNPLAGMCYCTSLEFNSFPLKGDEPIRKLSDQRINSVLPSILFRRPWDTSALMWRREATEKIGPWFPGWSWEDREYECRAGCHDIRVTHVDQPLCFFRRDPNQENLSMNPYRKAVITRTDSLLEMGRNLEKFGKTKDSVIKERIVEMLYSSGLIALQENENKMADKCLQNARRISGSLSIPDAIIAILISIKPFLSNKTTASLGYKMRPFISGTNKISLDTLFN